MATGSSTSRTGKIISVGLVLFVCLGCLIWLLCRFRIEYTTQNILNQQRDMEQAWVSKAIDAIAVWRNELMQQARFVSSSEMFRLFITDVADMEEQHRKVLHSPDSLHSSHEGLRSMAEQLTYLRDLLKDFTNRRAWSDARILTPDGTELVGKEFPLPLQDEQKKLAEAACKAGKPIFGPIRMENGLLVMDMADPLFEVLGAGEPKPVGVLMLSVPMERPLTSFLSSQTDQREGLDARIVQKNGDASTVAMIESGIVMLESAPGAPEPDYPFMLRKSVYGNREVYSLGAKPNGLDWQYVLEMPASLVQERIRDQEIQIYALGGLATLGLALLGAFVWASLTSRQHRERVRELTALNNTINEQKTILESINSSLDVGLLLVDDHDNVLVANPNFLRIIGRDYAIDPHTPLAEVLPAEALLPVQQEMRQVEQSEKSSYKDLLLEAPNSRDLRIYRVTYYPYTRQDTDNGEVCVGCVSVFQDVTFWRNQARIQKEREEAMLSALGRAVESVDPNLVGQSDKMARVAALVAEELKLDQRDRDTLRISSHLSQLGKIFVPRELLTAKRNLTEEEKAEINRAPEYADKILHGLHFDLPIRETVSQITQKLDENGCDTESGEKMTQCGRALAVINAFIAMTSQRGYRPALTPEQALDILAKDSSFCQDTVAALRSLDQEMLRNALS